MVHARAAARVANGEPVDVHHDAARRTRPQVRRALRFDALMLGSHRGFEKKIPRIEKKNARAIIPRGSFFGRSGVFFGMCSTTLEETLDLGARARCSRGEATAIWRRRLTRGRGWRRSSMSTKPTRRRKKVHLSASFVPPFSPLLTRTTTSLNYEDVKTKHCSLSSLSLEETLSFIHTDPCDPERTPSKDNSPGTRRESTKRRARVRARKACRGFRRAS